MIMRAITTVLIAALVVLLSGFVVIYAGVYDVSATVPHWPVTRWVMETARIRSIKAHAAGIAVPPNFDDPAKIPIGVEHFAAHCAVCHGAPGVPRGDIAQGLYPPPPDLAKTARLYSSAELFWIVKHGIKSAFHDGAHDQIAAIETAYRALAPLLGAGAAGLFMLALLASGFSSSIVGLMAGQVIMHGFVSFGIPLWARRLVVMVPSFAVVTAGMDITHALVLSQVILSLVLPIPMVAPVTLTANRNVMGDFANTRLLNAAAIAATAFVCILNGVLLLGTAGLSGA
jgi:mono/diheme cytochrome c family protein